MKKETLVELPLLEGMRQTAPRREILATVLEMKGHFDPQTLHDRLRANGSRISRASVYRTIPILVEQGILTEVEKTEKHAHYESTIGKAHHDHLICLSCGKAIEVCSPALEVLQEEICQRAAFKGIRHTLEIMGYCKKCAPD